MKWEDYNSMNDKLKEEYNYRFTNHPIVIDVRCIAFIIIIFYLLMNVMLFISYIVITDEKFEVYKDSAVNLLVSSSQFMMTGVILILLIAIINIINIFISIYKEKKWIKQNNIKITHTNILVKMFRSRS